MLNVTFDEQKITEIIEASVRKVLTENSNTPAKVEQDIWMDIDALCQYHPDRPEKSTVYAWIHKKIIPFHKSTKKVSFLKSEIDKWIKSKKVKCYSELQSDAL